jgi:hypothetical protein
MTGDTFAGRSGETAWPLVGSSAAATDARGEPRPQPLAVPLPTLSAAVDVPPLGLFEAGALSSSGGAEYSSSTSAPKARPLMTALASSSADDARAHGNQQTIEIAGSLPICVM